MVQVRWEHLNREYSHLTQAQAIFLDGHFVIEHTARNRSGRFFNFNGTAGVWRRATIEEAGGWQHDTLTEEPGPQLSRAARGLAVRLLARGRLTSGSAGGDERLQVPAAPLAKGSVQTARKLLPRILRSDLSREVKVEAFFHLSANFTYPLMILLTVLMPVSMVIRFKHGWYEVLLLDLPFFWTATVSVVLFYVASQREIGIAWWKRLQYCPSSWRSGSGCASTRARP